MYNYYFYSKVYKTSYVIPKIIYLSSTFQIPLTLLEKKKIVRIVLVVIVKTKTVRLFDNHQSINQSMYYGSRTV